MLRLGEFAPAGCVAGLANGGTFSNITLFNCHPATYNTGVGGLIGWDSSDGKTYNFSDITINRSNMISALWGTYDAACGGIMGYLSESSTANINNCNIGPIMDVNNDVCGNYQYYQYRYSGMLIGTVGDDGTPNSNCIKCTNVDVNLGDWAMYYYCEFEKNSMASYSEDYQFSRVPNSELNYVDANGNGKLDVTEKVTGCKHNHTAEENNQAVLLQFSQLYTGYGWGASPVYGHDGVTVNNYDYTVTYIDDVTIPGVSQTIAVEYKMDNSTEYIPTRTLADISNNIKFDGWVTITGVKKEEIGVGNTIDYVLYPAWTNVYYARFVDSEGNLLYTSQINTKDGSLKDSSGIPASYEKDDVVYSWNHYKDLTKGASSDVIIWPKQEYNGELNLVPHYNDNGQLTHYTVESKSGLKGKLVIPGSVNNVPVRVVVDVSDDGVFPNGTWGEGISSIIINEGVEEISSNALAYTLDLKAVTIPSTMQKIGSNAFATVLGGLTEKKVEISFNGTWQRWTEICEARWDSGLAAGSTVVCKDAEGNIHTYRKNRDGWNSGNQYWTEVVN